ncbi:MAG TPA: glycine betaine ABC transporter substrate-binding protein [Bacillales bacterium]|nr:glycine betaine ABC transporter substrate-binding protein [Bacillales bacterium]
MIRKIQFVSLGFVMMFSLLLTACGSSGNEGEGGSANSGSGNEGNASEQNNEGNSAGDMKLGDKKIVLLGDNYQSATASMYVAKQALEKAGYKVQIKQVGVGTMFAGVAEGSADATLAVWLPHTHASYWKQYKDQLDKLGVLMEKVPLGLTVPSYMEDIQSIEDLANNKNNIGEKLDWTITGISPGAGEMKVTNKQVMPSYKMKDKWDVQASSGPAMTAALSKAIQEKKPIVVTLWKPHWAFVKWDLRILKDPKNKYGDPDDVYAVTRQGLKEDSPIAYKILSQFHWTKEQDAKVMLKMQKGMDADKAAEEFVKNHPDLVSEWMKGIETQ